jgi:hypothetical protein
MSSARHHAEWLSLIEVSGPFLSMPVLLRVFPQGLDAVDPDLKNILRLAYEEWADNQRGLQPDEAMHTQWLRFVLSTVLGMEIMSGLRQRPGLLTGAALPPAVRVNFQEHHEVLFPDYALVAPGEPRPRLLIQQYPLSQDLNKPIGKRHWTDSPALRMMQLLRASEVRLGLVTNGEHWMLVDAPRQETTGFISWYAHLWTEEPLTLRAFQSLLHQRRFFGVAESDTLEAMLTESASNQQEVTDQLGYQVRRAVELLIQSLDRIDKERGHTLLATVSETQLYEAALTVMMRLVFLLSAEERKLLPLGESLYDQYYAASTLQAQLRKQADQYGEEVLERRYDAWSRLLALFRVVYGGVKHADLRLRAYDGHLFNPDRFPFLEGRAPSTSWRDTQATPLPIDNRTVLHLLEALQLLQVEVPGGGPVETRRLSFRALDIEQIGHVYEGLLDHTARRTTEPVLSLSKSGKQREGMEIELAALEKITEKGEQELLTFLEKNTGHSRNALQKMRAFIPNVFQLEQIKRACDDDPILLQRVLPLAGLLRKDSFGHPLVITASSVYMTTGADRRTTGTHYTPRSLTEPLVQHTLDPLVYEGPAEGWPQEQWQLRSVQEILDLKVCDFAMGSGAFLVQTCRYLASKLVEAWEEVEWRMPGQPITTEGKPATGAPSEPLLAKDAEERLAQARRLVAERCLYGVDKNPMAVEMAKLSLWLITLDKDRPFTFLDHALCFGDSLLGVTIDQLTSWSMKPDAKAQQLVWVQGPLKHALDTALKLRRQIRMLSGNTIENVATKNRLLKEANQAMELLKLGADLLIVTTLHNLDKTKRNEKDKLNGNDGDQKAKDEQKDNQIPLAEHFQDLLLLMNSFEDASKQNWRESARNENQVAFEQMRKHVDELLGDRKPFHWPLMFPEAFVEHQGEPGFAAIVGNPPFQGGKKITLALGTEYRDYLLEYLANGKRGNADLCAYFFLRAVSLIRQDGITALLATNTIAQGDTREVGLEQINSSGRTIIRAVPSRKWPGQASLEVASVWLRNGLWNGDYLLDDRPVNNISAFLTQTGGVEGTPYKLVANANKSFQGSVVLGEGFVLEPAQAEVLIAKDPRNQDVLFPYLNGEDLNSRPDQSPSRWVIHFHEWSIERAKCYSDCFKIVEDKVKPQREAASKFARKEWWLHHRTRPALYSTIGEMKQVLIIALTSRTCAFNFVPNDKVFSHTVVILAFDQFEYLSLLQSSIHLGWVFTYGSSLKGDQRYTPTDCFETFPFPLNMDSLEDIGERYYTHRQAIMLTRQEGLTKTYNRFHNPQELAADIVKLRELHKEMDEAVAAAYGWQDLALGHGFHETKQGVRYTICEEARREVLDRLLRLNHERYAEEVALGLHEKEAKGAKGSRKGKGSNSLGSENGKKGMSDEGVEQRALF